MTENLDQGAASVWTKCNAPAGTQGHPFVVRVLKNGHLLVSYSGRRTGSPLQFTASSGVFYSADKGTTWSDKSHTAMKYWTKDVVIDPADTSESTWYAAVFSGWGSAVPAGTGGLYRTTDKGLTWKKISDPGASYRVNSCTVNPAKPEEMYYTTETDGLWFTANKFAASPVFTLVNSYPFRHPVRVQINPYRNSEVWVSGFGSGMMVGNTGSSGASVETIPNRVSQLNIYPNPSNGHFVIRHTPSDGKAVIEVYTMQGEKAFSTVSYGKEQIELNMSGQTPGIYLVYFRSEGFLGMGKIMLCP